MLENAGFAVTSRNSPLGLSTVFSRTPPDAALIDVSMPALRGDRVVEILKRHFTDESEPERRCAVVLFSGTSPGELMKIADACGADAFLSKTLPPEELGPRLRKIIARCREEPATC